MRYKTCYHKIWHFYKFERMSNDINTLKYFLTVQKKSFKKNYEKKGEKERKT